MSKDIKRAARRFLNPKHHWDTGILEWNVEQTNGYTDARFDIWDCSKKISLSFNIVNEIDAKNRAKKLEILITELTNFREALADALANSVLRPIDDEDDYDS